MLSVTVITNELLKKGVIFDFDGTIVDSYTRRNLAHLYAGKLLTDYENRTFGCNHSAHSMAKILSQLEEEMTKKLVYNREIWFQEAIKRQMGCLPKVPKNLLFNTAVCYWETIIQNSCVYTGVIEALTKLKLTTHLGLISDTDGLRGMKKRRIHESGLEGFFEAIVISGEDTEAVKPSTQPFLKISTLLDVMPCDCVYIGDNPSVDITGAKDAGMKAIIINNSTVDEKKIKADYILNRNSFAQIESLIYSIFNI
jgi:putative hydrolase of the HAD superfamily